MDWSVNKNGVRPLGVEAIDGLLTTMRGAVVHDPENAAGRLVALAEIFVFNPGGAVRSGRQSRLFWATSLNAGLFVCGNDIVVGAQWSALPSGVGKDRGWGRL